MLLGMKCARPSPCRCYGGRRRLSHSAWCGHLGRGRSRARSMSLGMRWPHARSQAASDGGCGLERQARQEMDIAISARAPSAATPAAAAAAFGRAGRPQQRLQEAGPPLAEVVSCQGHPCF